MLYMVSILPNVLCPQGTHGLRQYLPIKLILKVSPVHLPYQIHIHLIHSPHPHLIHNSCMTFSLQTGRNPEIWGIASGKKVVCPGQVQGINELTEVIDKNIRDAKSALCNSRKPHPQQCSSSFTCTSEEVTVPSYLFTSCVFQQHSGVQRLRQGRVVSEILDEGLLTEPYPSTNVIFTALLSSPLAVM